MKENYSFAIQHRDIDEWTVPIPDSGGKQEKTIDLLHLEDYLSYETVASILQNHSKICLMSTATPTS